MRQGITVKTERNGRIVVIEAPDEAVIDQAFLLTPPKGCTYDIEKRLFTLSAVNGEFTYQVSDVLDYSSRAFIAHRLQAGT